jgi:hypothetical protein
MMHLLDLIVQNGTDASETLSPPGVGGNITEPSQVRAVFGGRVAMIGGLDQFNILTVGTAAQIRAEVRRLFEGFGREGGYICSASDHSSKHQREPEDLQDSPGSDPCEDSGGPVGADVPVVALASGRASNVFAGSLTVMAKPPVGVEYVINRRDILNGTDTETDEDLRERAKRALEMAGKATA